MLKFLKNILATKKESPSSLAFDEIPAWLDERERTAREMLRSETKTPVHNIRNATANLQLIVNNLKGAEQDPETHPKIKSIAKNSLPLFLKAMNASLSKELPEDTDEFYAAAVESVKGCLNAARGQGRYLMVAFPNEMKATKSGIDAIGREINVMTGALGSFKKELTFIEAARRSYTDIVDLREDMLKSVEKENRTTIRIHEIAARLSAIGEEQQQLANDDAMQSLTTQKTQHGELESERDALMRTYAALSMTASHVFRKSEKIANRQQHTAEMHTFKKAMECLSDHHVASAEEITAALNAACPIAQRMINEEEISLKNKEERTMFADTVQFCTGLAATSSRYHEVSRECDAMGEALTAHPIISKMNSLERERTQLQIMLAHEEQTAKELLEWRNKSAASIPGIQEELKEKLGEMIGETVQIQMNNPDLVGG
ncbi:MAG: hypothetical protein NTZ39_07180 [Methanoregula sp.]|nr:hypothetical protein [Methanoregula sp.]